MAVSWTSRGISRFTEWLDGGSEPSQATVAIDKGCSNMGNQGHERVDRDSERQRLLAYQRQSGNDELERQNRERRGRCALPGTSLAGTRLGRFRRDIPSSGAGFEAVVLTDTGGNPSVIAYIDLGRARTILNGTSLTIPSLALRFAEGRLPRGLGGDVASLPQQAYLSQSGQNTWHEVLDHTAGGGFFHSVRVGHVTNSADFDFRITVDGNEATLEGDSNQVDGRLGFNTGTRLAAYEGTIRFDESLKVEYRTIENGNFNAKVYYSTDL